MASLEGWGSTIELHPHGLGWGGVLSDTFFDPFVLPAEAEGDLQGIKVSGLVRRCELDPLDFLLTPRGVA